MPEVQITVTADELDTADELFALLKELNSQGWRGSLSVGTLPEDPGGGMGWRMQAHREPDEPGDITRSLTAAIGDVKVVIGGVVNVMTADAYQAAYGGL